MSYTGKLFLNIVLGALCPLVAFAYQPRISDVDIRVSLSKDGSAHISERWDVVVAGGTEWYLVRENLGDMEISGLQVSDESGLHYSNIGRWRTDRSLEQKAGLCGINPTSAGCELCWGVGSYGPHVFTVEYDMSCAVKSLEDYDMLHIQFLSDELSSPPGHVRWSLDAPVLLSNENTRIWGFGLVGEDGFSGGKVWMESTEPLRSNSSLIVLLRFDKGIFESPSTRNIDFQEVLDRALEGASFSDDGEDDSLDSIMGLLFSLFILFCSFVLPTIAAIKNKHNPKMVRKIFGVRKLPKKFDWYRELPFGGNIYETYYVASHEKGVDDGSYTIVSAMILRLIQDGFLILKDDTGGKKQFVFGNAGKESSLSSPMDSLLELLKEAAGKDKILQEKEFRRWAMSHDGQVKLFLAEVLRKESTDLKWDGCITGTDPTAGFSDKGREEAFHCLGFRQYLKDFTLVNQRYPSEVGLWGDYLVMAAVFGIADKVAKDMKNLAPQELDAVSAVNFADYSNYIYFADSLSRSARNAFAYSPYKSSGGSGGSRGGFGGHISFGGGGGFSGGGHGGGSR